MLTKIELRLKLRFHIIASILMSSLVCWWCRHRVETYRDVTDRCKHCGRLRYHVPTFFPATGWKMINCAFSASLEWVVFRSSSNQMHASSNLQSMRTKKVGTLVTSLYVSTLWCRQMTLDNMFCLNNIWVDLNRSDKWIQYKPDVIQKLSFSFNQLVSREDIWKS
jgi:hypothetical protein